MLQCSCLRSLRQESSRTDGTVPCGGADLDPDAYGFGVRCLGDVHGSDEIADVLLGERDENRLLEFRIARHGIELYRDANL